MSGCTAIRSCTSAGYTDAGHRLVGRPGGGLGADQRRPGGASSYFDNDAHAHAPYDARRLAERLGVAVPLPGHRCRTDHGPAPKARRRCRTPMGPDKAPGPMVPARACGCECRDYRMINPPVLARAALNRAVASAQFTMFHHALT